MGAAFLKEWAMATWEITLEAGPWLVGGFLLAGVIHVLVSVEKVTRHLGTRGLRGVLKAALVGIPLPLCSCSVIPVASSIRRHGATRGATASFLISTPETGVDSIAISYALLGPFFAVIRPIASLLTAVAAGLAVDWFDRPTSSSPAPKESSAGNKPPAQSCCHSVQGEPTHEHHHAMSAKPMPLRWHKAKKAVTYGFGDMFEDLAHWLVVGFVLAGLISALVPEDFLAQHIGKGPLAMLLMIVVGLPMYVCATASTPVAAILIAKGLSPGAALVFLLVGPATNIATMVVVARDLGRRSLTLYLAAIGAGALLFGLLTDALVTASPSLHDSVHEHHHAGASAISWIGAVALGLLIINGLRMKIRTYLAAHQTAHADHSGNVSFTLPLVPPRDR